MDGKGILDGYKIIDLSSVVLGPYCTQMLGDLGADVIKIEVPSGDIMRHAGPMKNPGMGPIYLTINRNKRSMSLDLSKSQSKEILTRLLEDADAIIHNIRAGGIKRLGFDYDSVKEINPEIIYVHAVGYGTGGQYEGRQAYDDLVQAACGLATMLPRQDGTEAPRYFPGLVADKTTGLYAAYATMAAFLHRERTGRGQHVEVPMLECMVAYTMAENLFGHTFVPPLADTAYTRSITPMRKPYQTKDGYIAIMPYTNDNWEQFFKIGRMPDIIQDPKFSTYVERTKNITELYGYAEKVALLHTTDEWMEKLKEANVPSMRVHTLSSILDEPHIRETGFVEERVHPTEGPYLAVNNPIKFSDTPTDIFTEPRQLGEDNEKLLEELGYGPMEINDIIESGALG